MAAPTVTKGRAQGVTRGQLANRRKNRTRTDFKKVYSDKRDPFDLNEQQFRFKLIRPEATNVSFGDRIEQVEWRDEGTQDNINTIPVLRGSISWREDDPKTDQEDLDVGDGHQVLCEVRWHAKWEPLWQMRIVAPPERDVVAGTSTAQLADDLLLATLSKGTFRYRKGTKKRKRGWKYHEIVEDVCKRYHIRIGSLVRGTEWIETLEGKDISPLEMIRKAVEEEKKATGKRYVIVWQPTRDKNGKWRFGLHVKHPTRNPYLYAMRKQIRSATSAPTRRASLVTSVVASGSSKDKSGKRKKLEARVNADGRGNSALRKGKRRKGTNYIGRYGFIERHLKVEGNVSRGKLIKRAKHELAISVMEVRKLTNFVHYGIAFMRRGDTTRVDLPEYGYKGRTAYLFVVSVVHTLTPSDYTMSLELTTENPLDPKKLKEEVEKATRAKKRKTKGKKKT